MPKKSYSEYMNSSAQLQATQELPNSHINVLNYKGEHAAIGGIGIIHGLASNDELLLLLTLSLGLASFLDIFVGLVIFTISNPIELAI